MFTGLVEEVGTFVSLSTNGTYARMTVRAPSFAGALTRGQSVAVSGACLTVASCGEGLFSVDVMCETLAKTKFRSLRPGARLNLERALRVGDRLDGHIVTGHVDGVAAVRGLRKGNEGFLLDVELSSEMLQLLVPKGSIAIDGTSLTIADFEGAICTVSLIPETLKATNLGDLRPGDDVHIEMDILGKYVRRLLGAMVPGEFGRKGLPAAGDNDTPSGLSMDSFRKAGWL